MVLHMDALGGVPKGVTTKMVIERADGLNVYVPCVTDSTCKSCTPTYRTERQVPAGDDALEGGKTKKVRSGAVTLRRAARKGLL